MRIWLPIVLLLLAALACNLSGNDNNPSARPAVTLIPTQSPNAVLTPQTPFRIVTITPFATGAAVPLSTSGVVATQSNCIVQSGWPLYTVAAGDTVGVIAQRTGATITQLVQANCLASAELIYIGQQLRVPTLPPQPTARPTTNPNAPVVQQGLILEPSWQNSAGQLITYSETARLNLGEVLNAIRVTFYVADPGGAIAIGTDEDPWDGAFIDYDFPFAGTYTFQAVVQNDTTQVNTLPVTIIYDPNYAPPGGQHNLLTVSPYTRVQIGWTYVRADSTVTILWPDAPVGANSCRFFDVTNGYRRHPHPYRHGSESC